MHITSSDAVNLFLMVVPPSRSLRISDKNSENSKRTAASPLFFHSPGCRRSRISAENAMSMADNLLQKRPKTAKTARVPDVV
jgi:hypothetical protein